MKKNLGLGLIKGFEGTSNCTSIPHQEGSPYTRPTLHGGHPDWTRLEDVPEKVWEREDLLVLRYLSVVVGPGVTSAPFDGTIDCGRTPTTDPFSIRRSHHSVRATPATKESE